MPALDESAGLTTVERPLNARSTNQNQNQNHISPPNPPAGGAVGGLAIATAISAHFPERRRTRIAEVAELVASLEASGEVTGEQLLQAAEQQAELLGRDSGKACPNVLTWLRRQGWLDSAALPAGGGIASGWAETRSGIVLVVPESLKKSKEAVYEKQAQVITFRDFFDQEIRASRPALLLTG